MSNFREILRKFFFNECQAQALAKKQFFSFSQQHRNIYHDEINLDVPHPSGGGLQPQIEMGPFLMALGELWRQNEE